MIRPSHRLPRWQRRCLDLCAVATLVTGIAWLAIHYLAGAGRGELPHPAEAWLMRLHGLAAFAALFVLGVLAAGHVPLGWRLSGRHRWAGQRLTGITLCVCAAALSLSGYLLYYFASEGSRPALGWLHAGFGVLMGGMALLHVRRLGRSSGITLTDNRSHLH
jgi:hypothetical protein